MQFNPARLGIARKRRLLNKKQLAAQINVELRTIVRWERSQAEPTPENLEALVNVLRFPKAFFQGEDIDDPIREYISFRSQKAMTAAEREAALAAGQIAFVVADWVMTEFNLPQTDIPDLHLFAPPQAARMLRQNWGLGEQPISNMVQLLEAKGVRVFALAENTAHVNAFSLWRKSVPYVFLNTFKSAESSRFDAAHELAHIVLHQDGGAKGREAEEQANRFAAAFLMPEADVISSLPQAHSLEELVRSKKRWCVSVAALNYRLHELGLISDWKYRGFCIQIAKLGYNKDEPDEIERETSVVWDKIFKALWAEKTAPIDIANRLGLPTSEVADLTFGLMKQANAPGSGAPQLEIIPKPETA